MKTRSRKINTADDDRETDSDESSYTNSLSKRRKRIPLTDHVNKYTRSVTLGMQLPYTRKNHMSMELQREMPTSGKREPKTSPVISTPSHSSSNQAYVNGDDNVEGKQSVRRSTRQRKFMYDNLNQTWLLASSIPDFAKLEPLFSAEQSSPQEECVRPRRSERNQNHELRRLGLASDGLDFEDMYSRVKRERRKAVHGFYARRISQDGGSMADTEDTDQNISDLDTIDNGIDDLVAGIAVEPQEDGVVHNNKYSLRQKRSITERFQFPIEPVRPRRSATSNLFDAPRHLQQHRERETFKSTAHRSPLFRRKRHAIHNSSSTSSSSDDERRFEKRKARSMARARNRCLPINFVEEDLSKGAIRDRMKIGSSLADIDPMCIDKTVSFDNIGGLDHHIQSLKEMILFPLMYPEVFERFKISPPRGVLFHGQPGTGKTLVARALANECSNKDRKVAFFMRKGADCLSKWVGESERQLRLLFDQAYSMRPSIIFFDEIDGLAPVRSTRQDQIHSSIVSTLLALMDGLDNRGEIVVIGATNRIDAIDPALRRPGRFDREMLFPLPSVEARERILKINMHHWNPPISDALISELASRTTGYCGADLKALCTEAALVALRRRYPQIYGSKQKLQLDVNTIQVLSRDFFGAMKKMKPSVQRSSVFSAKPLSDTLKPLLERMLKNALAKVKIVFPVACTSVKSKVFRSHENPSALTNEAFSEDSDSSFFQDSVPLCNDSDTDKDDENSEPVFNASRHSRYLWPCVHRPRFLLSGLKGQGQGSVAPAILYLLEHIPVHRLDIPALYAVTCRAPEEACANIFQEAQRNLPSIVFIPHVGHWWETLSETVQATFLSLLQDLDPCLPLMLLATSDCLANQLPPEVQDIFSLSCNCIMHMENPTAEERKKFFASLLDEIFIPPKKKVLKEIVEDLPVAAPPASRTLTTAELNKLRQREEATLRELRLFLRDILNRLARDRRFAVFARPVDPQEVPDYQEVIKDPMDLETMMTKIDLHRYETVAQFLNDIDLVCQNALEYNPDRDPSDKLIRHRACALKDIAHALVLSELDDEFEKICHDIQLARKERGESVKDLPPILPKTRTATKHPVCSTDHNSATKPEVKDGIVSTESSLPNSLPPGCRRKIRKLSSTEQETDKKIERYSPPRRSVRYMIWRKKKSPWFGSCRRKLIRRTINHTTDLKSRKVIKRCTALVSPKSSPVISPTRKKAFVNSTKKSPSANVNKNIKNSDQKENLYVKLKENMSDDAVLSSKEVNETNCSQNFSNVSSSSITFDENIKQSTSECRSTTACDILKNNSCSKNLLIGSPTTKEAKSHFRGKKEPVVESSIQGRSTISTADIEDGVTNNSATESDISNIDVTVDRNAVQHFLVLVVKATENCTVETLQYLFSLLQQIIYRHRKEWDKKNLLLELENELQNFCQHMTS